MQHYALLKCVGRDEYVVVKYTDHCLGVLAHFLTDGGSADNFRTWIDRTEKGVVAGKLTFLRKNGDHIIVGLEPEITGKKDQFETSKYELLSYIDFWQKERKRNSDEVLIQREGETIVFHGKVNI